MVRIYALAALAMTFGISISRAAGWPAEQRFRDLYKELVETNTTQSTGSCTLAAERIAARLRMSGVPNSSLHLFVVPNYPLDGSLVVVYPGRDSRAKAILLLAHLDVVEAKRGDWSRDPFTLIEEQGEFFGRGALDDKAEAAIWVDTLLRFLDERYRPRRTVKVVLTCGEESGGRLNGVHWLIENQRDLIDAAYAINEGGIGELDAQGRRIALEVEAAEKTAQNFQLEVTNPGGHSSRPRQDNAIYILAAALRRIESYEFDAQFNAANRAYFGGMAKIQQARGESALAAAMTSLVADPHTIQAIELVSRAEPAWNAALRTTCVATTIEGGHAQNALPQRARANINCRIFPGVSPAVVRTQIEKVIDDSAVQIQTLPIHHPPSSPPPLTRSILEPIERIAAKFWPSVPVLPTLEAVGTDGTLLNVAGIATYGIEPIFVGADLGNIHGLNEHVGVQALLEGREFLYQLIKVYADRP